MENFNSLFEIKSTITSHLPDSKVLLFGSKVNGTDNVNSDFDLLVITRKNFSEIEKSNWARLLHNELIKKISAPVDVVLQSEEEVETYKNYVGHIVRYAINQGIYL